MTQEEALNILKMGHNVFLTGQAGSGKTYILNKYIEYLKEKNVGVAVTASTGIAATHLNGKTIHSWSGIKIRERMTDKEVKDLSKNRILSERFRKAKVLIIDEISMLHSFRLDLVQKILRVAKGNFEPFGGMQVVLCGDFFQLPPVTKNGDSSEYFAFKSNSWNSTDLKICYLESQHRNTDHVYYAVLNKIRTNMVDQEVIRILKSRYQESIPDKKMTRLYTHNIDVDAINNVELSKLPGKPKSYYMQSNGSQKLVAELKRNCLAQEELILKEKAIVMFIKNNFDRGYVNGTIGTVEKFDEYDNPVVHTRNGNLIAALPESWGFEENGKVLAEISQVPLRLAWAITVHKSQGISLDAAEVDLSKSFEPGMGYVALSRIRTLNGLRLMGLNETALTISGEVLEFDKELFKLSEKETQIVQKLSLKDMEDKQRLFIEKFKSNAGIFGRNIGAIRSRLKSLVE
ncbi:MAG: PIF1 family DEAD/DEAH box helicase [Candidatus Jorgensenbacteria bacterium]